MFALFIVFECFKVVGSSVVGGGVPPSDGGSPVLHWGVAHSPTYGLVVVVESLGIYLLIAHLGNINLYLPEGGGRETHALWCLAHHLMVIYIYILIYILIFIYINIYSIIYIYIGCF